MDLDDDVRTTKRDPRNVSALGRSDLRLRSFLCRFWTKVNQINCACAGEIAVCSTVFRSTISCFVPENEVYFLRHLKSELANDYTDS